MIHRCYSVIIVLILLVSGLLIYYYLDPAQYVFIPKCPVKLITGLDCPGCGFQRALHAFLHGNIREGISYNPFILFAVSIILVWLFNMFLYLKGKNLRVFLIKVNRFLIFIYIIGYFLWFIIRNINWKDRKQSSFFKYNHNNNVFGLYFEI